MLSNEPSRDLSGSLPPLHSRHFLIVRLGAITYALELTAAGLIIQYWNSSLNIGIFIAVFWVFFTALNFLPVRWFGELEMWFSSIKVITILGFLIFGICVDAGVGKQGYLGFHNVSTIH